MALRRYVASFGASLACLAAAIIFAMIQLSSIPAALLGLLGLAIAGVIALHYLFFYPLSACMYIHGDLYVLEVRTPIASVAVSCDRVAIGDATLATTPLLGVKLGRKVLGLFTYAGGGRILCFGAYAVGIVGRATDEPYVIYLSCRGLESLVNCLKSGDCRYACTA